MIAVVVEDFWPEGFVIHGIAASVEQAAILAVGKNFSNQTQIEMVPMGIPLMESNRLDGSIINGAVEIYNIDGTKSS